MITLQVTNESACTELLEPGRYQFTTHVDTYWALGAGPAVRRDKNGRYQSGAENRNRCTLKIRKPTRIHVISKSKDGTAEVKYLGPLKVKEDAGE